MKKIFFLFSLFFYLCANAQQERIVSFHSDITLDTTTTIHVKELIKVYAAGDQIKRGIFRTLPLVRNINGNDYKINYDITSVKRNGSKENYHTEKNNLSYKIYIGDKDINLKEGIYLYEITYSATNQIGFFKNYDELYWNVNGNEWNFPIENISATVTLPVGAKIIQSACYTGSYGNTSGNCSDEKLSENAIQWKAQDLLAGEGLTVAVGFTKGIIVQPPPPPPPSFFEKFGLAIFLSIFSLGLLLYFYVSWRKYGVDPPKPTIYPQLNIPDNLSPASLGYIHKEYYFNKLLTASLINLAIKGYIHIDQNEQRTLGIFKNTNFLLKKMKPADENLPIEEKNLLDNLFAEVENIHIDGKYNKNVESAVETFKYNLPYKHKTLMKEGANSKKLTLPSVSIFIIYLLSLFIAGLTSNNIFSSMVMGIFIFILSIGSFFFVTYLLHRFKWMWWVFGAVSLFIIIIFYTVFAVDVKRTAHLNYYTIIGFLLFSFISLTIYRYLIRKPSEEKMAIQSLIDGFKMYLETAEEKLLQYFNPPTITPQIFEILLPYAMVLGVDKIWGQKFENTLSQMSKVPENYYPSWYNGPVFSPILLADSLNSSMSQSIASTSTPPSQSGSGSGGGGFSGGGGGGGGGGGW